MAKSRRIRWECPNGLHASVLGSTRPPLDATVRFCWSCSQESGRLVKRVAPALEAKRAAGAQRSAAKAKAKTERERQAAIAAVSAPVTDDDEPVRVDRLLREAWALKTRRTEAPNLVMPDLTVRRGGKPYTSGHTHYAGHIVVTIGRVDTADVIAIVLHEAAHDVAEESGRRRRRKVGATVNPGRGHGALFRSIFRGMVADWTGVTPPTGEGLDKYEFHVAMERHIRDVA